MLSLVHFLILLILPYSSLGQIKIGEKVELSKIGLLPMTTPRLDTSKFIVLDFWATWCAPCIASFPHLDDLQRKYADRVQIIAISDEPESRVRNFLSSRDQYAFAMYLDPEKALFSLFEISLRPTTCVLQPDGELLWVGRSGELDQFLEHYLDRMDRSPISPSRVGQAFQKYYHFATDDSGPGQLLDYHISLSGPEDAYEALTQKGARADSSLNIYYRGASVLEVLKDLLDVSDLQTTNNRPDLDTIMINLTAISHTPRISFNSEVTNIISDLQDLFDIRLTLDHDSVDAYQLTVVEAKKLTAFQETNEGGGMVASTTDKYVVTRMSLEQLAGFFQKKLKAHIRVEGAETGKFSMELDKFRTIEDLNRNLTEQFGILLTKGRIRVRTVKVS